MSAENNCLPPCEEFNMVQRLTEELSDADDKAVKDAEEIKECNKTINELRVDKRVLTDNLWVKDTFIDYCMRGGDIDAHSDIWEHFELEIDSKFMNYENSGCNNQYEIFVEMLERVLGLFDYDLKDEEEIRDDFQYEVDDYYLWKNKSVDEILEYQVDTNDMNFKELPFKNCGERVFWLIS